MFDLKKALAEWKRSLRKYESFEDGAIMELESHLLDEFDRQKKNGLADEEAFTKAAASVGRPEDVGGEYFKDSRRSLLASPSWEKTRFSIALPVNYLKVAWRTFRIQLGYSFLNIFGLALGLASAILILLWIQDEASFDRFHANAGQISQVIVSSKDGKEYSTHTPGPLAPVLKKDFPEISEAARLVPLNALAVKHGERSFILQGTFVDPSFFAIFRFPFLRGDPRLALNDPSSVVLSASAARRLFPQGDPIGRTIQFEWWGEWVDMNVAAIIRDIPRNSHLQYEFFAPTSWVEKYGWKLDNWTDSSYPAYVLLQPHASRDAVQNKIAGTIKAFRAESPAWWVRLHPLTRIHLHEFSGGGLIVYIYVFLSIGILILVIAGINFVNLATARSLQRLKEVGLRKVIGSSRGQLIRQFMGESVLSALCALAIAVVIVALALPALNAALQKNLQLRPAVGQALIFLSTALLLGLCSGVYPAFFLSRTTPACALRNSPAANWTGGFLRRLLVIAQFTISIFFIFASFVALRQLTFMKNKDLGFQKDHVVAWKMRGSFFDKMQAIRSRLLENPNVLSVTAFNGSFTGESNGTNISDWEGRQSQAALGVSIQAVDENFIRTFGVRLSQGRFFAGSRIADANEAVVINEAAAESLGLKDPIGKWLKVQIADRQSVRRIIGVLKNFHLTSLHQRIDPLVMVMAPWWYRQVFIRIGPRDAGSTLAFIRRSIKQIAPDVPDDYAFLNEGIDRLYQGERQVANLLICGTFIALVITALGLFGLILHTIGRKRKEIGVRKVLGASEADIVKLLCLDLLKWIAVACVLAWPLAYYALNRWLGNFTYRVHIGTGAFLFSGVALTLLALSAVGFMAVRAARANPVESLRYE